MYYTLEEIDAAWLLDARKDDDAGQLFGGATVLLKAVHDLQQQIADLKVELVDLRAAYAEVSKVNAELRQQLDAQIALNVQERGDKRILQATLQSGLGILHGAVLEAMPARELVPLGCRVCGGPTGVSSTPELAHCPAFCPEHSHVAKETV